MRLTDRRPPDEQLAEIRGAGVVWTLMHRVGNARLEALCVDPEASYLLYDIDLRGLAAEQVREAIGSAVRLVLDQQGVQVWFWDAVRRWLVVLGYPILRAAGPLLVDSPPPAGVPIEVDPRGPALQARLRWGQGEGAGSATVHFDEESGAWRHV